jgi:uncharacterized membrane protein AbrB (regulator of aidB expression)
LPTPQQRARRLNALTTIIELSGAAAIVYGVSLIAIPIAWILGGVLAIAASYMLIRSARRS